MNQLLESISAAQRQMVTSDIANVIVDSHANKSIEPTDSESIVEYQKLLTLENSNEPVPSTSTSSAQKQPSSNVNTTVIVNNCTNETTLRNASNITQILLPPANIKIGRPKGSG